MQATFWREVAVVMAREIEQRLGARDGTGVLMVWCDECQAYKAWWHSHVW